MQQMPGTVWGSQPVVLYLKNNMKSLILCFLLLSSDPSLSPPAGRIERVVQRVGLGAIIGRSEADTVAL